MRLKLERKNIKKINFFSNFTCLSDIMQIAFAAEVSKFKEDIFMKKLLRIRISILLAILLLPVCANATTIDFYTDGTIVDGNHFDTVNVWNDANVTMTGGWAFYCNLYDSSKFNTYGGDAGVLYTHQNSQAWLYANDSVGADIYDQSVVHLFNGEYSSSFFIYDSGHMFMAILYYLMEMTG
jgi:hypothetical protein